MGFLTSLFGGEGFSFWSVGLALIIVLLLIVAAVWILKVVFNASSNVVRGRNKRLAVIDNLSIDGKRNLILVRRDGVEHLLLVGGTQDAVVETGIPADISAPAPSAIRPKNETPEQRQKTSASRLGLTGVLRRQLAPAAAATTAKLMPKSQSANNSMGGESAGDTSSPLSPLERLKALGMRPDENPPTSLRHTGLLRPKEADQGDAEDFDDQASTKSDELNRFNDATDPTQSVNGGTNQQFQRQPDNDSDNVASEFGDVDAMSRIEEGSGLTDVGARIDKKSGKKGAPKGSDS